MSKFIKAGFVATLLLVLPAMAVAEGKIAVLSIQEAIINTDEAQEKIKQLRQQDDYLENKKQLEELQKEGVALMEQMKKDEAIMNDQQREEMRKKVLSKRGDMEHIVRKLQESEKELGQKLLQEMAPKAKAIVGELIKTEGIGLLLDSQAAMHADSSFNITPKVTDKLNQNK